MPIEPRLYQKYTGKVPGEAMNRFGESLARDAARRSRENSSDRPAPGMIRFLGISMRTRMLISVIASLAVLIGLLLGLI